ncbi:MAG: hypothetical protein KDB69_04645 [Acidimicrobiia bacterium]|nr:hypothetical protein [Acidimicrobiia bacterium]
MRITSNRILITTSLFVVALAVVGCGGSTTDSVVDSSTTTTTTVPVSEITPDQEAFIDALAAAGRSDIAAGVALATAESVCRDLKLLQAAGTPPGHAANAIESVVLDSETATERADYGLVLALAPTVLCEEVFRFAEQVSYWLGY